MTATQSTDNPLRRRVPVLRRRLAHEVALLPGLALVALMLVWAVHDGGYDADTWYWGALVVLGILASVVVARGWHAVTLSRSATAALIAFALYVAWSYLSI